jgi:hypothetical protein
MQGSEEDILKFKQEMKSSKEGICCFTIVLLFVLYFLLSMILIIVRDKF